MAPIVPYIPETITVHLGAPDAGAENVTVSFSDYVKNVLSSEVYPTWEPAALRANALAVISFALNRVYTEYYRSRGYPFDITSSTAIDQKFINGRNIYENISALVDELFTDYLRRQGYVEPLAAKFCNGVTTTCDGLSQWGSQELAQAEQAWAEATPENAQERAGALLFAAADSLRLSGVDAEEALSAASRRFSEKLKQENQ